MHEELLERRLRGILRDEADSLPLTITAAELERRMLLRRRPIAGRRLTLLLAAAVGIGLFGVGGAVSGLFDQPRPTRTSPAMAVDATDAAPTAVPSPDGLIATAPPVTMTRALPGWLLSGGLGPTYALDNRVERLGGAGDGEDHVQVILSCTGTAPIEVVVEDGTPIGAHTQRFEASCSDEGQTSSHTFKVTEHGVSVSYIAPQGTWTALSILVPDANH
jgi:hypothetical protein